MLILSETKLNVMKRILNFLAILMLSIATAHIAIADGNTTSLPKKTVRLEKKIQSNNGSPRTLGDMFITCYYNNECIEVEFPAEVDCMDVSISDGATIIWSGFVTADTPVCDIPNLVGVYNIVCTTDNGAVYQGMLSL